MVKAIRQNKKFMVRVICSATTLLLVATIAQSSLVNALSTDQQTTFNEGINYFDNESTSCSGSGSTSLSGSDNEQKIWNYFKSKSLGDGQVAGIVGNLQQESSFDPEQVQSGGDSATQPLVDGVGWGLAQWTYSGQIVTNLLSQNHLSGQPQDLSTQLDLIWAQLNGTSPIGLSNVLKGLPNNAVSAATYFDKNFEGGTDPPSPPSLHLPGLNIREAYAQIAFNKYQGSGGGTTIGTNGNSCGSSGGGVGCLSVSGDAKILCAAKVYDPVDYVYGGGHSGGAAYHAGCPVIQANNTACGLDCSGLVSVAVYDAFNDNGSWDTTALLSDTKNWKQISFTQAQPGDLIEPDTAHVEVIDHIQGSTIYTFGAHSAHRPQPDQVGPASYVESSGYVFIHYIGQGS